MAKNTMEMTMVTRKQNVSKILMYQLLADLKRRIKGTDDPRSAARESWLYQLLNPQEMGRLDGIGFNADFQARFNYLRYGALEVVYYNNQGCVSATFSNTEVCCTVALLKRKAHALVKAEVEVAERRLEKQRAERRSEMLTYLGRYLGVLELREQLQKLQDDYESLQWMHGEMEEMVRGLKDVRAAESSSIREVVPRVERHEDDDLYI